MKGTYIFKNLARTDIPELKGVNISSYIVIHGNETDARDKHKRLLTYDLSLYFKNDKALTAAVNQVDADSIILEYPAHYGTSMTIKGTIEHEWANLNRP